ncbi:MAG: hypothetical protein KME17_22845 [Cyanosarcina radialis HA8281-LM2]|jgi:hypothetical protein|nr:hypothetical protein [Cyanosarcina radialis HA8281-LM2]
MNKIPKSSQVSLSKGFWFIFRDGEREIAAHGSTITGRERIFVNGELISEKRSLSKRSEHQFTVNENIYKVIFVVPQILQGKMECSLIKDGKCIRAFKTSPKNSKFRTLDFIILGLIGGVSGFLISHFKLPFWLIFFVIFAVIVIRVSQATKEIVIDDIEV